MKSGNGREDGRYGIEGAEMSGGTICHFSFVALGIAEQKAEITGVGEPIFVRADTLFCDFIFPVLGRRRHERKVAASQIPGLEQCFRDNGVRWKLDFEEFVTKARPEMIEGLLACCSHDSPLVAYTRNRPLLANQQAHIA